MEFRSADIQKEVKRDYEIVTVRVLQSLDDNELRLEAQS